uniref:Uncharacterized protein n=1 Tax=Tanacetum cinerariifolium TaxID=118510 RepID=A0A699JQS4_TANCI|nr:hypothetical protein [Tanacetum cinerariifolium]
MGDANPIRTLGDYSKPRHEGYRSTIELLVGNNVYCMDDPEQAFVEYASSHTDEAGESEEEEKDSLENTNTSHSASPDPSILFINEKVCKLNLFFKSLGLAPQLSGTEFVSTKGDDGDVMFTEIVKKDDDSCVTHLNRVYAEYGVRGRYFSVKVTQDMRERPLNEMFKMYLVDLINSHNIGPKMVYIKCK